MEEVQGPDPTTVLIEDLTGRIAGAQLEAAQWKTRALIAENGLAEIAAAQAAYEVDDDEATDEDGDE